MMKKILILLLSVFILSCNSDNTTQREMTNIESTLIAKGNLYGNGAEGIVEQNVVISNQLTWNALIDQMDSVNNVSDGFTETEINFF